MCSPRHIYPASAPLLLAAAALCGGCGNAALNDPYPAADRGQNILYSSFSERPKHLDPVRSYVENEYALIAQIYEPPLQYHYLKRPYQLIPLTAVALPKPRYLDAAGEPLADSAPASRIAFSVYDIRIQPGIRYQPHPAFARDSQGKLRYRHLDPGALQRIHRLADFKHTGTRELVADDYVYQLKRMAHPRLHCPITGLMNAYIVGLDAYAATLRAAYAELSEHGPAKPWLDLRRYPHPGVKTVDRYTYRVTIRGKYPQFVYWLAMPFFAPMPWEADRFHGQPGMSERNLTLDWYAVGTGPFMLTENNPNRRMVLDRNPNFHGERYPTEGMPADRAAGLLAHAGKPMPFIERAIYSLEKETIPYWNKFLQGYYDRSGISSDSFDQAIAFTPQGDVALTDGLRAKGIQLTTTVETSIRYWAFNMLDPIVGGYGERARKLRQAISIAIDQEEFISIFANGRGIPAQGPIPPGIFGHRARQAGVNRYVYDWHRGAPRRKSLDRARELLAEAGYPRGRHAGTGKPLVLYFDTAATGPDAKARLDWTRKQLAKLDIQLVIRATDFNRFQDKVRKGMWQLFLWGWNADYPDPENFLFLHYGPNGKVKHEGENQANYHNAEFDRLFEQMKHMDNSPQRQAIVNQMVEILRHDAPWIWGYFPKAFTLHHDWYGNSKPNLMANNTLKYARVDALARGQQRARWNRPKLWPIALIALVLLGSLIPAAIAFRRRERMAAR